MVIGERVFSHTRFNQRSFVYKIDFDLNRDGSYFSKLRSAIPNIPIDLFMFCSG
jgi:hypothetical protein